MEKEKTGTTRSGRTKLLLADDHPVVTEGIIRAFEKEPDFEIVGTVSDGLQAVRGVKTLKPDMVIMDIQMPNMKGIDATHEIKTWKERIHVLIYTMHLERGYITTLFRLGISGYVLKSEPIKDLVRAAKVIRDGGTYFSGRVQQILQQQLDVLTMGDLAEVRELGNGIAKLTVREREVFALLADGVTPKEVAERLCISPKTAEAHKYNIMEKLNVSSVAQLTKIAIKKDLIQV